MQRKILAALLALLMVLTMALPTFAVPSSSDYTKRADTLYALGLFKGVSTTEIDYALDVAPTRNEALVMLIRLLGKEEAAKSGTWKHPFTDVVDWMQKYVGYAYENGLTIGIGNNEFGGANTVKVQDYLTFVLRALGYNDTESTATDVDFTWLDPFTLANKLGLTDQLYSKYTSNFLRRDVVYISYNALAANVKGSNNTLLNKLVNKDKAVDSAKVATAGLASLTKTVSESLTFDTEYKSITSGSTFTLKATIYPSYTTAATIKFESSNTSVATVTSSGVVTGVAAGVATIYATATDGGSYAYCVVKVTNSSASATLLGAEFAFSSAYLKSGESAYFPIETYPSGASASLYFASSDTNVATVDSSTGKVTAKAVTTAKTVSIYARSSSSSGTILATLSLTVYPSTSSNVYANTRTALTKVSITNASMSVTTSAGATKIAYTTTPANADKTALTWSSSNTSVATVSDGGYVTGVSAGTATITVTGTTDAGKSVNSSIAVTVTGASTTPTTSTSKEAIFRFSIFNMLSGTTMTPTTSTVNVSTAQQVYRVLPVTTTAGVYWTSSNTAVATVNSSTGAVTAQTVTSAASTTISVYASASDLTLLGSYTLTVYPTGTSIANTADTVTNMVYTSSAAVAVGATSRLTFSTYPTGADQTAITWSTSNSAVATVNYGYVTGVKAGTAVITARLVSGTTYTFNVTVTAASASSSFDIKSSYYYFKQGLSTAFYIPYSYPSATSSSNITWTSSNPTYVTVESGGKITIPSTPTLSSTTAVTITANDATTGLSDSCIIYVVPASLVNTSTATSCTLSNSTITCAVGTSNTIVPVSSVYPSGTANTINWVSSNSDVAYINNQYINAVAKGTATIYGYSASGSILASLTVTVSDGNDYYTSLTYKNVIPTSMEAGTSATYNASTYYTLSPTSPNSKTVTWVSTNKSAATVSGSATSLTIKALAEGTTNIYAVNGEGDEIENSRFILYVTIPETYTKVEFDKVSITALAGGETTVTYTVTPVNVSNNTINAISSDVDVVAIVSAPSTNSNGTGSFVIKGLKTGTATITLSNSANKSFDTLNVTVESSEDCKTLKFDKKSYSFSIPATGTSYVTQTIKFTTTPSDFRLDSIRFQSNDTSKVVIDSYTNNTLTIKIIGTVTTSPVSITAWGSSNQMLNSCTITTIAPVITAVSVKPDITNPLYVGNTRQFTATLTPENGDKTGYKWESTNTSVATVDSNGLVTAVGIGTTEISYKSGTGAGNSYDLTVSYDTIKSITCTASTETLNVNYNPVPHTFTIVTANGGKFDPSIESEITVKSSDSTVISISISPQSFDYNNKAYTVNVTALKAGTATITLTAPTYSSSTSCTITFTVTETVPDDTGTGS